MNKHGIQKYGEDHRFGSGEKTHPKNFRCTKKNSVVIMPTVQEKETKRLIIECGIPALPRRGIVMSWKASDEQPLHPRLHLDVTRHPVEGGVLK